MDYSTSDSATTVIMYPHRGTKTIDGEPPCHCDMIEIVRGTHKDGCEWKKWWDENGNC